MKYPKTGGYTLIELIVAVGLFAVVMTLAAGGYLVMIGVARQTQATSLGINNLAFALETMTRTIRTGTSYDCGAGGSTDCPSGDTSFTVLSPANVSTTYSRSAQGVILQSSSQGTFPLTDPSINVTSILFYAHGTGKPGSGDYIQPRVLITVSGSVSAGANKTIPFTVQTQATMRGSDI